MKKYEPFFKMCVEKGISESQLVISSHYSLSFSIFEGEKREYQISDGERVTAKGIYKGKLGSVNLDCWSNKDIDKITDEIISQAQIIENHDPVFIYEGSKKYSKFNVFNKELTQIPIQEKIELTFKLHNKIKTGDQRVDKVEVNYEEVVTSETMINSKGLKLTQKTNYFIVDAGVYVKDENGVVKTGNDVLISNHFSDFDFEKMAQKCLNDGLSKLGGSGLESKKYKAILKPEVVATLLMAYLPHAYLDNVQKGTSVWIDKKGRDVASKKLSIIDQPVTKNVFGRYFDDEGVACTNKPIIKYGILSHYLSDLTSSAKDGTDSTGNGFGSSKISVGTCFVTIRPGRKTLEQLMTKMEEGVYITEVAGLQGINAQNGDFSLQSSGFLVQEGRIVKPLDLMTISGNLFTLFKDVTDVGSELELHLSGALIPPLLIKKLLIASKEEG